MTGRLSLLCLPHAGGSAAYFRPWRGALRSAADVVPVEVAGHGARRNETPPVTFADALGSVWDAVTARTRDRYALFGHSLGALYAFEIARRLTHLGQPPVLLLVSGRNGPSRPAAIADCHSLPDPDFVARLATFGGLPAEIASDPALVRLFLPVLRADMRIAERYTRARSAPLRCPVIVFSGARDPMVTAEGLATWRQETSGHCEIVTLPGGHFCRREDYLPPLREILSGDLTPLARRQALTWRIG